MGIRLESAGDGRFSWQGKNLRVEILHARAGLAQQIWVENDVGSILVDCGDGCLRDIIYNGLNLRRLEAFLFTHGHFDHVGGLHSLLGFMRMIGRERALNVVMPEGCSEVKAIIESYLNVYADSMPFEMALSDLKPNQTVRLADMDLRSYEVVHSGSTISGKILDKIPALGYRISYEDESIAVTGDTGECPSLKALVEDASLAIIEATFLDSSDLDPEVVRRVHLTEDIAAKLGESAENYVLVHRGRR